MEGEGEPQLAELEAGKTFMIFDVSEITASAPAPLAEIRSEVATGVMLEKGSALAKAAADKIVAAARKGTDLGAAMAAMGRPLPPVDRVSMGRQEMAAMGQRTPPPFRVLFSMAQGTVKLLPAPNNRGWYVIALNQIVPGQIAAGDPRLAQVRQELGRLSGMEYAAALRRAAQLEVGVERNEAAIRAVRNQLTGAN
jgi:peptidyl-prolyl cis-trans isomerase D